MQRLSESLQAMATNFNAVEWVVNLTSGVSLASFQILIGYSKARRRGREHYIESGKMKQKAMQLQPENFGF